MKYKNRIIYPLVLAFTLSCLIFFTRSYKTAASSNSEPSPSLSDENSSPEVSPGYQHPDLAKDGNSPEILMTSEYLDVLEKSPPLWGDDFELHKELINRSALSSDFVSRIEDCLAKTRIELRQAELDATQIHYTNSELNIEIGRFPDQGSRIYNQLESCIKEKFGNDIAAELLNLKKHGFYSGLQQMGLKRRTINIVKSLNEAGNKYMVHDTTYIVHHFDGTQSSADAFVEMDYRIIDKTLNRGDLNIYLADLSRQIPSWF